jgi:hypothetical protein
MVSAGWLTTLPTASSPAFWLTTSPFWQHPSMTQARAVYRDLLRAARSAFNNDANMLTQSRAELRSNFDVRCSSSCASCLSPHPIAATTFSIDPPLCLCTLSTTSTAPARRILG